MAWRAVVVVGLVVMACTKDKPVEVDAGVPETPDAAVAELPVLEVDAGPMVRAHALILTGAATVDEARELFSKVSLAQPIQAQRGYPQLVESSTIKGLKPGFFIVVAGFCRSKADANRLREVQALYVGEGAYVREVQVPDSWLQNCPSLHALERSGRVVERVLLASRVPSSRWVVRQQKRADTCSDWNLDVEVDGVAVDRVSFEDERCGPDEFTTYRHSFEIIPFDGGTLVRHDGVHGHVHDWEYNFEHSVELFDSCGMLVPSFFRNFGNSPLHIEPGVTGESLLVRQGNTGSRWVRGEGCTFVSEP